MKNKLYLITICCLLVLLGLSCQISRYVIYNFADIHDHKKFPARTLTRDSAHFSFNVSGNCKTLFHTSGADSTSMAFENFLDKHGTVAFLIIRNDTILFEKYFHGYKMTDKIPSFSMAKSVTSILIGCAIDDSLIHSVNDPVSMYIPELHDRGFDSVTVKHLLQMTSGLEFNESYYNPFGDAASFYYGRNLRKKISRMSLKSAPGEQFEYVSGNTQLLGLVLERALKTKTITAYFQEKLWKPMGMEYDGSWSLDRRNHGLEKTFCCLNARARDFAKIGRLYLKNGNWNGKQLVSESWVKASTALDTDEGSAWFYQYQWWLPSRDGDFMAHGILGQYIYVSPKNNMIIVRLGKREGGVDWENIFSDIADVKS